MQSNDHQPQSHPPKNRILHCIGLDNQDRSALPSFGRRKSWAYSYQRRAITSIANHRSRCRIIVHRRRRGASSIDCRLLRFTSSTRTCRAVGTAGNGAIVPCAVIVRGTAALREKESQLPRTTKRKEKEYTHYPDSPILLQLCGWSLGHCAGTAVEPLCCPPPFELPEYEDPSDP